MIRAAGVLWMTITFLSVPDATTHPWSFTSAETLDTRVPALAGFTRTSVDDGSFGAFLRTVPIAQSDAKVKDFRGAPLYEDGRHPGIAGVIDIDVGARDLQQCADAVIRMHAEWHYGRGDRDQAYHAASGTLLSYKRWLGGARMVAGEGGKASLRDVASPRRDDHAAFRAWLDEVFTWANTSSLTKEGTQVPFAEVRPGDFFVMTGSPFGHAVLVLDVAKDVSGRTALLLGQSYMPAQSFQLLRPARDATWFVVEPGATEVKTPFWAPFPMRTLRRMP